MLHVPRILPFAPPQGKQLRAGRAARAAIPEYRLAADERRPAFGIAELWQHRELLQFFLWRDVAVRYKQTLLGVGWAVLQPLTSMAVFSVVFGRLAQLDSDGVPYPAFSLAGLLPWLLFASGLTSAANSLVGNVNLLTKVYFPRPLLPLSNVLASLLDFAVSFVVLLLVLAWYGMWPGWRMLLVPLPVGMVLAAALGAGCWLAAFNAQYRDVRHVLPFLVQTWMYGTPIVYSLSIVPPAWRTLFALNPMVGAVAGFRFCLLGTDSLAPGAMLVSMLSAMALLVSGLWYFRRHERLVADTI